MVNEDNILVVQKNPFGADIEIGVNADGRVVQNFTMKQGRKGGDLMRIKYGE